jgi:class 3 adenylate cyclase
VLRVSQWVDLSLIPRTVAYSVTGVAVLSLSGTARSGHGLALATLYLLSFPWLLHGWMGRAAKRIESASPNGERWFGAQLLENLLTGFAVGSVSAPWITCVGVSACLLMGNAALGGPALFRRALPVLMLALTLGFSVSGGRAFGTSHWLCDALSGFLILWFGAVVGFRGYQQACRIHDARMHLERKSRELASLSARLASYLPDQLYARSRVALRHGGTERKWLTVLFVDIAGFTELTERLAAEDLTEILNDYLGTMAVVARQHGGTVDKFIGDGVMVFFGDPETRGRAGDASSCVHMAIEMRRSFAALCARWAQRHRESVAGVRIGMDSGFCHVGDFGSGQRFDYTAVGRAVNLASRLEKEARPQQILMSRNTWELVKDEISCEFVAHVHVKGIAESIDAFGAC